MFCFFVFNGSSFLFLFLHFAFFVFAFVCYWFAIRVFIFSLFLFCVVFPYSFLSFVSLFFFFFFSCTLVYPSSLCNWVSKNAPKLNQFCRDFLGIIRGEFSWFDPPSESQGG